MPNDLLAPGFMSKDFIHLSYSLLDIQTYFITQYIIR
jgi:hypothetical protein